MGRTAGHTAGSIGAAALMIVWGLLNGAAAPPAGAATPTYAAASTTAGPPASGSADLGNHCDDCTTTLSPGFSIQLYGLVVSTLRVSSNGNVQAGTAALDSASTVLPNSDFGLAVFPFWDDLRTDTPNSGVFSTVLGSPGSRALVLEWRATMFTTGEAVDVTLVLHEDTSNFETYYTTLPANAGATATEGVQRNGQGPATQWASRAAVLAAGEEVTYTLSAAPPTITGAPAVAISPGGQLGATPRGVALAVRVSWGVAQGSAPLCSTQLDRSINGRAWTSIPVASASATTATDSLTIASAHYRYEVDVTDCNGGTTGWVMGPSFTYALVQDASSQITYAPAPSWTNVACASCSGGHARLTTGAGASASMVAHAAVAVGLIMETGPHDGRATVSIDNVAFPLTTTSGTVGYRIVALAHGWVAAGAHTIRVQNLATAGDPAIELDAVAVLTSP